MTLPDSENSRNSKSKRSNKQQEPSSSFAEDNSMEPTENQEPRSESVPDFDFPRMDDDVEAFRRELDAIRPPTFEHLPEEPVFSNVVQAPRRRRRASRLADRPSVSELGLRLESIVQRASPSFDFFVFSLLCGCVLSIGYILDSPAILVIGIFLSPLLGPWVGTTLSAATGEFRLFRQTFGGLLTGLLIVFITGILGGLLSRFFQPLTTSQALFHARLWWPDLLMLVLGTIILVIGFIQSDEKPVIPSLMVAYEIFLPASAAGFGLGSGVQGLWPEAGLVFLIHLALSLIIGLIMLFYMGFRPLEASGYFLTIGAVLFGLVVLAGFVGLGSLSNVRGDKIATTVPPIPTTTMPAQPAQITTPRPSQVFSATPTFTALPPTPTRPLSTSTVQPSPGPTLLPTPVYGRVESLSGGVMVRVKPGGTSITTVQNGYLVEIQPDTPVVIDGATWIHVIIKTPTRDIDGWVLLDLIVTATPSFSP